MSDSIDDLLPFYALDSLTPDERQRVEAYLAANPERRREVEELRKAAGALPYAASAIEPTAETKRTLMARVRADAAASQARDGAEPAAPVHTVSPRRLTTAPLATPERETRGLSGWFHRLVPAYALAGLALLAALVAGGLLLALNGEVARLRGEVAALRLDVQTQDALLAAQQRDLATVSERLAQAGERGLQSFALNGTEARPQAQGQLIADPSGASGVLIVSELVPLAENQVYQVWLIAGQTPVSAGLLQVDEQGRGVVIVAGRAAISGYDALGVSIEPSGGSVAPTGEIVILSELG